MLRIGKERFDKVIDWGYQIGSVLFDKMREKSPLKIELTPEA